MRTLQNLPNCVEAVLAADGLSFTELVSVAGLDPKYDFRYARIIGVNFDGQVLDGFDFTGTQFVDCNFVGANLSGCVIDDINVPRLSADLASDELRDTIDELLSRRPLPTAELSRFPRQYGFLAGAALLRKMAKHDLRADVVAAMGEALPAQTLFDAVASAAMALHAFPAADARPGNIASRRQAITRLAQGLSRASQFSNEVKVLKNLLAGTHSFISAVAMSSVLADLGARPSRSDREKIAALVHVGVWSKGGPTAKGAFSWLSRQFEWSIERRYPIERQDFYALTASCEKPNQALSILAMMEKAGVKLDHRLAEKLADKLRPLRPRQMKSSYLDFDGWVKVRERMVLASRSAGEAFAYFSSYSSEGEATASELDYLLRIGAAESKVESYRAAR